MHKRKLRLWNLMVLSEIVEAIFNRDSRGEKEWSLSKIANLRSRTSELRNETESSEQRP
jgi:hypothetical protein